jgi:hypothetical protein
MQRTAALTAGGSAAAPDGVLARVHDSAGLALGGNLPASVLGRAPFTTAELWLWLVWLRLLFRRHARTSSKVRGVHEETAGTRPHKTREGHLET